MYHLLGSILLRTIDPYFRRHLTSKSLNATDYMYLETLIYTSVLFLFIIFNYFYKKKETFQTIQNIQSIKFRDVIFMAISSFFFIYSTLMIYENEHNNTAFSNGVLLRGGSLVGILIVGIFFYEEKYTWKQVIGIILTFIGIYLLMSK
jgi:drug/metabolite transporter (DMT)-like permease